MPRIFSLFLLLFPFLLIGQTPKPNIKKISFLQYAENNIVKREINYYWIGWNFVEKREVYRPINPKDTLYFYMGNKKEGTLSYEIYEVVPRKGASTPPPSIYALEQLNTKIRNSVMTGSLADENENVNITKCKMKILQTYPLLYCDKDKYPIEKKLSEDFIDKQWTNLAKYKADGMRAIAKMMEIQPGATPTFEEKYLIYDYLKKMDAFDFAKVAKSYNFSMIAEKEGKAVILSGKIAPDGTISETKTSETEFPQCISK